VLSLEPSPYARLATLLLAVAATLLAQNPVATLAAYAVALSVLLFCKGVRPAHAKFLLFAVVPFALWNALLWGVLVAAPPGAVPRTNPIGGVEYATLMTTRLALLALAFQLCFIGLPIPRLLKLLRAWGVKGDALLIIAGSFTIWPELRDRADHVVTARYARGLVSKRSTWESLRALPLILKPVISNSLHHSIERSEMWEHQGLLERILEEPQHLRSFCAVDCFWFALASLWMIASVWTR
jgi:energy-coupling factor transporter transmembrane protein EcfT